MNILIDQRTEYMSHHAGHGYRWYSFGCVMVGDLPLQHIELCLCLAVCLCTFVLCLKLCVVSYMWSSTQARGPCRRTWTSRWPAHLGCWQKWSSHNVESLSQREVCCAPAGEQSPEYRPRLGRDSKQMWSYSSAFVSLWIQLYLGNSLGNSEMQMSTLRKRCEERIKLCVCFTQDSYSKWQNQKYRWHRQRHGKWLTVKLPTEHSTDWMELDDFVCSCFNVVKMMPHKLPDHEINIQVRNTSNRSITFKNQ